MKKKFLTMTLVFLLVMAIPCIGLAAVNQHYESGTFNGYSYSVDGRMPNSSQTYNTLTYNGSSTLRIDGSTGVINLSTLRTRTWSKNTSGTKAITLSFSISGSECFGSATYTDKINGSVVDSFTLNP